MPLPVPFHLKYGQIISKVILFSSLVMLTLENARLRISIERFEKTRDERLSALKAELSLLKANNSIQNITASK